MTMTEKLSLVAKDDKELQVIAACLQDGLVRIGDLQFYSGERRFVALINRFMWEEELSTNLDEPGSGDRQFASARMHQRVHCGIAIDGVRSIKMRGINRQEKSRILNLLTIRSEEGGMSLVFSGAATIRLETDGIACRLEDLDEPWPTAWRPRHEDAGGA
jgi:hypothetical protein